MAIAFRAAKPTAGPKKINAVVIPVSPIAEEPSKPTGAKRGRKPTDNAKKLITLRLDPEVIEGFKSTGEGWQSRINAALRQHLNLYPTANAIAVTEPAGYFVLKSLL